MGRSQQDETERKYDVDSATVFPNLAVVDGVVTVGQPQTFELDAVYFDTPGLDLVRHGVTLRRRTGGSDAGWHLKLPAGRDTRTEVHEPLGADSEVPARLRARVEAITGGQPLLRVATLSTRRREYPLVDGDGSVLAYVCDDEVRGRRLVGDERELQWREWEVELAEGPRDLLRSVEDQLVAAGAAPAAVGSKLARVIGELAPDRGAKVSASSGGKRTRTVEEVLAAQLAKHLQRLLEQDAAVRARQDEGVHQLRIAARRLRSTLTTYRPLLDTAVTDPVRVELRWLGEVFAQARDAQVLREHLRDMLAAEPAELVVGPVTARIDDELGAAYQAGRESATAALDSERYAQLLGTLEQLAASPPLVSSRRRSAKKALPRLLARDLERLDRAVHEIEVSQDPAERDAAFHEARKKAKRLRYAAESATSPLGKDAKRLAAATKKIQKTLGIHQDTVVARRWLRDVAMQSFLDGENTFTMGRLHALEQARADRAEIDFATLWARFDKKERHRWDR